MARSAEGGRSRSDRMGQRAPCPAVGAKRRTLYPQFDPQSDAPHHPACAHSSSPSPSSTCPPRRNRLPPRRRNGRPKSPPSPTPSARRPAVPPSRSTTACRKQRKPTPMKWPAVRRSRTKAPTAPTQDSAPAPRATHGTPSEKTSPLASRRRRQLDGGLRPQSRALYAEQKKQSMFPNHRKCCCGSFRPNLATSKKTETDTA